MVLNDCTVVFNTNNAIFYSGDTVTGSVILALRNNKVLKGLKVKVKGTSKASWTRPMPTVPYIRIYSEKLKVLRINLDIFQNINDKTVLPKTLSIPFQFNLPLNLPSSFKDSIAQTYYNLEIQAKRVYKIKDKKEFPFIVMSYLNLNILQDTFYNMLYLHETSKFFGKSKHFKLKIKTYKGVGSNQENIPFETYIVNERRVIVTKIIVSLVQNLEYNVQSGYYNTQKKIFEYEFKDVKNNFSETCIFFINIPSVVPSTINITRTLIKIAYVYKITVCFKYHFSLNMEVPVVIGTTRVIYTK